MRSSAPKRRLDVSQHSPTRAATGKRVAPRSRRLKRRFVPAPALIGVIALAVAGFGSVVVSSHADSTALASNAQSITANYTGSDGGVSADQTDVSRDFDRKLLAKQTSQQAKNLELALAEQADKVQNFADKAKLNQWVLPVAGYHLTARFGQRSSLWATVHTGLDFAGPSGTTIVSVAAGTVKSTAYEGAYGNRTIITLLDGTDIWYCHQSRFAVTPGEKVAPGQTIGYTGATGNVTGPHLHLEVHPGGGAAVDPFPALVAHGVTP